MTPESMRERARLLVAAGVVAGLATSAAQADYKDDIGFTALQAQLGGSIPTGASATGTHVEPREDDPDTDTDGPDYFPGSGGQFTGMTINPVTPSPQHSSHAQLVGQYFYGNTSSVAPGIPTVDSYWNGHWLGSGWMRLGTTAEPLTETRDVQNHSWLLNFDDPSTPDDNAAAAALNTETLRRLDYAINRDGFTAVVGVNNGSSSVQQPGFSSAYNAIAVGRSDGLHSPGGTSVDGPGREVPHIVAASGHGLSSFATGVVSGAAALVIDQANIAGTPNAREPEVVKAVLLAGATKEEFINWDQTPTRRIDNQFGAGELNVQNNYNIVAAGEQNAATNATVSITGWDFNTLNVNDATYFFDVPVGGTLSDLSVILTWNRVVTDGDGSADFGNLQSSLANLDLQLFNAIGVTTTGVPIDQSASTIENIEHIWMPGTLGPGRYALVVTSPDSDVEYGLAWRSELAVIPEPASAALLALGGLALLKRRAF